MMFNFILRNLFPVLKLKDKNISWGKRIYIYSEIFIMVYCISWCIGFILMHSMYKYKFNNDTISLYTNETIKPSSITRIFTQTQNRLQKHQIIQEKLQADIFLVNDDILYYMGMFPGMQYVMQDTGAYTFFDTIYFKQANINKNFVYSSVNKINPVPFVMVLAHELTHVWQDDTYGYIDNFLCEKWVKEGYAVYVSEELKALNGKKNFLFWIQQNHNHKEKITLHDKYILWGLMVKHAIEHMHKSVDDLHLGKVDYDEVLNSLLAEYNISKT